MSHEVTERLAQTDHGYVTVCACGCTHLTFGRVTLHFETPEAFEAMTATVLSEERLRTIDEEFQVNYDWFSMSLTVLGSLEFARLVREAVAKLTWSRGDLEFTDEDLRQICKDVTP